MSLTDMSPVKEREGFLVIELVGIFRPLAAEVESHRLREVRFEVVVGSWMVLVVVAAGLYI